MRENYDLKPVYTATGRVIHGRGIGKHVGTPTANIETGKNTALPETGVYTAKILLNQRIYYGVTHVGTRPTVDNDTDISVETHIFNFDMDIYGQIITVKLYKKLREIQKFDELSFLIEQVKKDKLLAKSFWGIDQTDPTLFLDMKKHCVRIGSREIYLSANEFKVLHLLYRFPEITFTKKDIYEKVWNEPANDHLHAVENTIFQIRKRLKPYCEGHEYIKTVIGYGYRFHTEK